MKTRIYRPGLLALSLLTLAACGGGGGGGGGGTSSVQGCSYAQSTEPVITTTGAHPSNTAAVRFLAQASFGASEASLNALTAGSFESWLTAQFALPQQLHLACVNQEAAAQAAVGKTLNHTHFLQSWWGQALSRNDQLRQRVAFALSQILVVSFDGSLSEQTPGVAAYYDVLGKHAFGNYRDLMEEVSLHPAMGVYLTHLRNQKEDGAGRVPDENYARELMQLFSIGLYELNADGSVKSSAGKPLETYTNDDVSGLARVFTGYSWGGPDTSDARFRDSSSVRAANSRVIPMQGYSKYHSISEKKFLTATIAAQGSADKTSMAADLKTALDTLFNHPNLPPFISKQMIQRLVTSNPSPAYVTRVASAFSSGTAYGFGSGKRGDMKALVAAILLDAEARPASPGTGNGKLREPVLRLANWARAFGATSRSGAYLVGNTDSNTSSLGQSPMRSPSVFNFYRPGYIPAGTRLATASLVAPEMQITHETTVAGYLNFMQSTVQYGVGTSSNGVRDVISAYEKELPLAASADQLLDRVNLMLMAGGMKASTRTSIKAALDAVTISSTNTTAADTARRQRVYLAVFLAMAAPEYLVQK